ncbi:MAG: hypothetical protein ACTSYA_11585 [Candidatus Kariarchaeaceae archaeon]
MGKLYTDTQPKYEPAEKPKEEKVGILNYLNNSYRLQCITLFMVFTIIGILVNLSFYGSTEIKAFLFGYGWVLLVLFSIIALLSSGSSSRMSGGGVIMGTTSSPMLNAGVGLSKRRRIRARFSSYTLWLFLYGVIITIIGYLF